MEGGRGGGGGNRFSDRRIWSQKAPGLWIFAENRANCRILKTEWIKDQLWILARIRDCVSLDVRLVGRLMSSSKLVPLSNVAHLNSDIRLLLELYCVIAIKHVAFFTIWAKLTVAFTCTSIPLYLDNSVFGCGCGCGFRFEQKFWRIDRFGKKKASIGEFAYPY